MKSGGGCRRGSDHWPLSGRSNSHSYCQTYGRNTRGFYSSSGFCI